VSLLFPAFCFSFTDPGRRELRERKRKEKEKELQISWGYLTLLPGVLSR
jgi:hypothetical protein